MLIEINTTREEEAVDITSVLNKALSELLSSNKLLKGSNRNEAFLVVYNPHTTSALLINEGTDVNLIKDILNTADRLILKHNNYKHDKIDNNAHAHIKTSLFKTSLLIPVKENKLNLGTWQHVFLLEFDGPRTRKLYINLC